MRPSDLEDAATLRRAANVLYERSTKRSIVLDAIVRVLRNTASRITSEAAS